MVDRDVVPGHHVCKTRPAASDVNHPVDALVIARLGDGAAVCAWLLRPALLDEEGVTIMSSLGKVIFALGIGNR